MIGFVTASSTNATQKRIGAVGSKKKQLLVGGYTYNQEDEVNNNLYILQSKQLSYHL